MQPVTSWSCPTHVVIGTGSARRYVQALERPFMVADAALDWEADLVREPGCSDREFIAHLAEIPPGVTVVAVGGGSVLDPVRVARSGLTWTGVGPVLLPAAPTAFCDVVCIPSTVGTAAEVSPVAVLRDGDEVTMLISPALRARVAVLDPDLTAGLSDEVLRQALIEPWARAVVPAVGDGLRLQDAMAFALAQVLEELAAAPVDTQRRLQAALASAQTHTAFTALQRSPFSHVLWPVVMEYAALAAVSKQAALAVLLPAWLRRVGREDLAARVERVWPSEPVEVDGDALDERVRRRWPMFEAPVGLVSPA